MTAKEIISASVIPTKEYQRFRLPMDEQEIETALTTIYLRLINIYSAENYKDLDATTKTYIHKVSHWLTSKTAKPCLMLYGGIGNGKTTMLKAIKELFNGIIKANELEKANLWKADEQEKSMSLWIDRYISTPEMYLASCIAQVRGVNYSNIRLLLIDDLGIEPTIVNDYGTETTPMVDLIYRRYEHRSFTVVTSNLDDETLEAKYGARVADRFNETFDKLNYTNGSYRR